jgi:hypothetical protein
MSLEFVSRVETTQQAWDALVNSSPDGWVFSLWGWQELILQVPRWSLKDHSFGVMNAGRLIAVVPLQCNPNVGALMSSGWGGSGPVLLGDITSKQREATLRFVLDHCKALANFCEASKIVYSVSPVTQTALDQRWGVNWFEIIGMKDASKLTQVIDLSRSEDELWAGLSGLAKRKIRKAKNCGYSAEKVSWIDNVDQYYEIHTQNYHRTGESPHPIEYFCGIAHNLSNEGYSVLFRALDNKGIISAFHNMARFGEGAYYHTGCSTPVAAESGVNYLLFWEAMLSAKKMGVRWYDAGWIFPHGATEKQKGLTHFKTRFGGEVHRSFFAELEMSPQKINDLAVPPPPSLLKRIVGRILEK